MCTSDYKNLKVWRKSMDLASVIYSFVKMLPGEERFALADQMRRSVVSIPSNIAEGQSRGTPKEFAHFLRIAKGSTSELETQFLLCVKLGFVGQVDAQKGLELCTEVGKMLRSLMLTCLQNDKSQSSTNPQPGFNDYPLTTTH